MGKESIYGLVRATYGEKGFNLTDAEFKADMKVAKNREQLYRNLTRDVEGFGMSWEEFNDNLNGNGGRGGVGGVDGGVGNGGNGGGVGGESGRSVGGGNGVKVKNKPEFQALLDSYNGLARDWNAVVEANVNNGDKEHFKENREVTRDTFGKRGEFLSAYDKLYFEDGKSRYEGMRDAKPEVAELMRDLRRREYRSRDRKEYEVMDLSGVSDEELARIADYLEDERKRAGEAAVGGTKKEDAKDKKRPEKRPWYMNVDPQAAAASEYAEGKLQQDTEGNRRRQAEGLWDKAINHIGEEKFRRDHKEVAEGAADVRKRIAERKADGGGGLELKHAADFAKDTEDILKGQSKYDAEKNSFGQSLGKHFEGFYRGAVDADNIPVYGGIAEATRYADVARVALKMHDKEKLTEDEKILLESYMGYLYAQEQIESQFGRAYKTGVGAGESAAFMAEMVMFDAAVKGAGKLASKAGAKMLPKIIASLYGDYAVKRGGERLAVKGVENEVARFATRTAGAAVQTALQASTYANLERDRARAALDGREFGFKEIAGSVGESFIEVMSEQAFNGANGWVMGKVYGGLDKMGLRFFGDLKDAGRFMRYSSQMIKSQPEEYLEEYEGAGMKIGLGMLLGDDDMVREAKETFTAGGTADMFLSFALPSAIGGGVYRGVSMAKGKRFDRSRAELAEAMVGDGMSYGDAVRQLQYTEASGSADEFARRAQALHQRVTQQGIEDGKSYKDAVAEADRLVGGYADRAAEYCDNAMRTLDEWNRMSAEEKEMSRKSIGGVLARVRNGEVDGKVADEVGAQYGVDVAGVVGDVSRGRDLGQLGEVEQKAFAEYFQRAMEQEVIEGKVEEAVEGVRGKADQNGNIHVVSVDGKEYHVVSEGDNTYTIEDDEGERRQVAKSRATEVSNRSAEEVGREVAAEMRDKLPKMNRFKKGSNMVMGDGRVGVVVEQRDEGVVLRRPKTAEERRGKRDDSDYVQEVVSWKDLDGKETVEVLPGMVIGDMTVSDVYEGEDGLKVWFEESRMPMTLSQVEEMLEKQGLSLMDEVKANADGSRGQERERQERQEEREKVEKEVVAEAEALAKRFGVEVNVITDERDIPEGSVRRAISERKRVEGWYDMNTGSVYLFLPNIESAERAKEVVFHEVVGHKGLRELVEIVGKGSYEELCMRVYEGMSRRDRERFEKYVRENGVTEESEVKVAAADEYMAFVAEEVGGKESLSEEDKGKLERIWEVVKSYMDLLFKGSAPLRRRDVLDLIEHSERLLENRGQVEREKAEAEARARVEEERAKREAYIKEKTKGKPKAWADAFRAAVESGNAMAEGYLTSPDFQNAVDGYELASEVIAGYALPDPKTKRRKGIRLDSAKDEIVGASGSKRDFPGGSLVFKNTDEAATIGELGDMVEALAADPRYGVDLQGRSGRDYVIEVIRESGSLYEMTHWLESNRVDWAWREIEEDKRRDVNARMGGHNLDDNDNDGTVTVGNDGDLGGEESGEGFVLPEAGGVEAAFRVKDDGLDGVVDEVKADDGSIVRKVGGGIRIDAPDGVRYSIRVYHGSAADFKEFDHRFMGSGEGNQAFGWGTYVSAVKGISKAYADTAKRNAESRQKRNNGWGKDGEVFPTGHDIGRYTSAEIGALRYLRSYYSVDKAIERVEEGIKEMNLKIELDNKNYYPNPDIKIDHINNFKQIIEKLKAIESVLEDIKSGKSDIKYHKEEVKPVERHLYEVEIPDDNTVGRRSWQQIEDELIGEENIGNWYYWKDGFLRLDLGEIQNSSDLNALVSWYNGRNAGDRLGEEEKRMLGNLDDKENYEKAKGIIEKIEGELDKLLDEMSAVYRSENAETVSYLDWDGEVPGSGGLVEKIGSRLLERKDFVEDEMYKMESLENKALYGDLRGSEIYKVLCDVLGHNDKKASQLLSELGVKGVKVSTGYGHTGRSTETKNYVIFDEKDARIVDNVRFRVEPEWGRMTDEERGYIGERAKIMRRQPQFRRGAGNAGESVVEFFGRYREWREANEAAFEQLGGDRLPEIPKRVRGDMTVTEYLDAYAAYMYAYDNQVVADEWNGRMREKHRLIADLGRLMFDSNRRLEKFYAQARRAGLNVTFGMNAYLDNMRRQARSNQAIKAFKVEWIQPMMKNVAIVVDQIKMLEKSWDFGWVLVNSKDADKKHKREGKRLTAEEVVHLYCQAKDIIEMEDMKQAVLNQIDDAERRKEKAAKAGKVDEAQAAQREADALRSGLDRFVDRGRVGFEVQTNTTPEKIVDFVESEVDAKDIANLWQSIRAVSNATFDYMIAAEYSNENEKRAVIGNRLYYVPERGFAYNEYKDDTATSSPFEKAEGRVSLAANPFIYLQEIADSAIQLSERNRTKRCMWDFLNDQKNYAYMQAAGAAKVARVWTVRRFDEDGNYVGDGLRFTAPTEEELAHDRAISERMKEIQGEIDALRDEIAVGNLTDAEVEQRRREMSVKIADHYRWSQQKIVKDVMRNDLMDKEETLIKINEGRFSDLTEDEWRLLASGTLARQNAVRDAKDATKHIVKVRVRGETYLMWFKDTDISYGVNGVTISGPIRRLEEGRSESEERLREKRLNNQRYGVADWLDVASLFPARFTRALSSMKTQFNWEFAYSNWTRDMQFAFIMNSIERDGVFAAKATARSLAVMPMIAKYLVRGEEKVGTLDGMTGLGKKQARYLKEFLAEGGETGYSFMQPASQRMIGYDNELKKMVGQLEKCNGDPVKIAKWMAEVQGNHTLMRNVGRTLEFMSQLSEMSTRLGQFVAERESGKTAAEAAMSAKEITTNFNRHGEMASVMGPLYMFYNATLQGTYRVIRSFYKDGEVQKRQFARFLGWKAAYTLFGMMQAMVWPGEDDPDEERFVPDWESKAYMCFGRFIVPTPHFFRADYYMGVCLAKALMGEKSWGEAVFDGVTNMMEEMVPANLALTQMLTYDKNAEMVGSFPIDKDFAMGIRNAAPAGIQPFVDNYLNKNYLGAPIYKKPYINNGVPLNDVQMGFNSTPDYIVDFCGALQDATGKMQEAMTGVPYTGHGDKKETKGIDLNPAKIHYLVRSYGGGAIDLSFRIAAMPFMFTEDGIETKNIPFVGRVYREFDRDRMTTQYFWDVQNMYMRWNNECKRAENGDDKELKRWVKESGYMKLKERWERGEFRRIRRKVEENTRLTDEELRDLVDFRREWMEIDN